ncbi:MAG: asparaginase [bacterium]
MTQTHEPVRIIVTGGTIDKVHDPHGEVLTFATDGSTRIPEILQSSRCYYPVVSQLLQIDSEEMRAEHREMIAMAVTAADEDAIVVTHGTSTMAKTALYLQQKNIGKTIILTGAMRPFSLSKSDGPFNLGAALIAAQLLPIGVFGVMNGRVFEADRLKKNIQQGRFDL